MTYIEMQMAMLKHRMSVNDMVMATHITKDAIKKYMTGKEEIPKWIELYFEGLNGESRQISQSKEPQQTG